MQDPQRSMTVSGLANCAVEPLMHDCNDFAMQCTREGDWYEIAAWGLRGLWRRKEEKELDY